jgi:hypothetical protein
MSATRANVNCPNSANHDFLTLAFMTVLILGRNRTVHQSLSRSSRLSQTVASGALSGGATDRPWLRGVFRVEQRSNDLADLATECASTLLALIVNHLKRLGFRAMVNGRDRQHRQGAAVADRRGIFYRQISDRFRRHSSAKHNEPYRSIVRPRDR